MHRTRVSQAQKPISAAATAAGSQAILLILQVTKITSRNTFTKVVSEYFSSSKIYNRLRNAQHPLSTELLSNSKV